MTQDRIEDTRFASEAVVQQWCDGIGGEGFRGTGTAAHERTIAWAEDELAGLPGLRLRTDDFEVLRWQPIPEGDLERAAGKVVLRDVFRITASP